MTDSRSRIWVLLMGIMLTCAAISLESGPVTRALSAVVDARAAELAAAEHLAALGSTPAGSMPPSAGAAVMPAPSASIIPLDFSAIIDNMQYQVSVSVARVLWMPHGILQSIAAVLHLLGSLLTTQLLPTVLQVVVDLLMSTGVVRLAMTAALILAGLTLIAAYLPIRVVEIGKVIGYGILAVVLLSQAPTLMADVEKFRTDTAHGVYQDVFDETRANSGTWASILAFPSPESWQTFTLTTAGSGVTARDVAASALECDPGEQLRSTMCHRFASRFYSDTSIRALDVGQRTAALQRALQGIERLVMTFPLSVTAILESIMELLFAIAGFFLMVSILMSVVFVFFLPTEGITMGLVRRYVGLLVLFIVVNVFIGVGLAMLAAAAGMGGLPRVVAVAAITMVFYFYGIMLGFSSVKEASGAFYSALLQAVGMPDPGKQALNFIGGAAKTAGGVALAATGAGLMTGGGLIASGLGDMAGAGETAQRVGGLMRTAGGVALGQSADRLGLGGAVGAVTTLQAIGDGSNIMDTLSGIPTSDAILVGTTAGKNPLATVIALDRAQRRRERWSGASDEGGNGRQGPAGQEAETESPEPRKPAPWVAHRDRAQHQAARDADAPYHPDNTPWRADIDRAMAMFGEQWATRVAHALVDAIEDYRSQAVPEDEIAGRFIGPDGRVSLTSEGVHTLMAHLPESNRNTLSQPVAQEALVGIVSEALMPQADLTRDDLAAAIAEGMRRGLGNDPTGAVAALLGTSKAGLGSSYSAVHTTVREAARSGLSADEVEVVLRGQKGIAGAEHLELAARVLPDSLHLVMTDARAGDGVVTTASAAPHDSTPRPLPAGSGGSQG